MEVKLHEYHWNYGGIRIFTDNPMDHTENQKVGSGTIFQCQC